jgi:cytosine/adenosine deaminase-related metal-dependent hydrolase
VAAAAAIPGAGAARVPAAVQPPRRTLIRGGGVLTMDPATGELPAGDVLIEGGRIVAVGKDIAAGDAEVIDAAGMIVMPGMIDGHRHVWEGFEAGHLVKTEPKGYAGYQTSKKRVMVCMTAEDHHLAAYIGGLQAIDSGVTALLDYAHIQYSQDRAIASAKGLQESGIGGWFGYQMSHSPTYGPGATVPMAQATAEQGAMADEAHFRTAAALQAQVFTDGAAPLQLGLCLSNGAFGAPMDKVKAELTRIRATGVKLVAAHSHRPDKPFPSGHFGARDSGIVDLHEAGLLGPDLHLSHGNDLTDAELALMAANGVMTCSTVMGEFPYKAQGRHGSVHGRARAAGVAAGIGIDVGLALTQDYFEHVRAAFWNLYLDPPGAALAAAYKSEDTLDFATRLGAKAIRLGDVTGTIAPGKRADLVLLRTDRFGFAMMGSLADRVVNFASLPDIDSVWVAGRLMKSRGRMIGVDWAVLKARLRAAQERVEAQTRTITFT